MMRKIKSNYTLKIILIAVLCILYIIIGVYLFKKPKIILDEREGFVDFDFKEFKGDLVKSVFGRKKKIEPIKTVEEKKIEKDAIVEQSYIIEQTRKDDKNMDDYVILGPDGHKRFHLDGFWNLNQIEFQIISTAGGALTVSHAGENRYSFKIEDIEVDYYYKKTTIIGKIIIRISNGEKKEIYLKKYKNSINFYDKYNNRVAQGKYFNTVPLEGDDAVKHSYKLLFHENYYKYRQIFMIIYIINLQILKFDTINSNALL